MELVRDYDEDYDGDQELQEAPEYVGTKNASQGSMDKKKASKLFFDYAKDKILEIFGKESSITQLKPELFLIKLDKIDLEFKTDNSLGLFDFRDLLLFLNDVYVFNNFNGKETPYIDSYLSGNESIHSAEIKKHKLSDAFSVVLFIKEPLTTGEYKKTRKVVVSINNFLKLSYNYAKENDLIYADIDEIMSLHDKILGRTFKDKIIECALVYVMILEAIKEDFEEIDMITDFNFVNPLASINKKYFRTINNLLDYVGFYNASMTTTALGRFVDDNDEAGAKLDAGQVVVGEHSVDFSEIYGLDTIKNELRALGEAIKYKYENKNSKIEIPKGVLLIGAPGTGKTFITKAFSKEYDITLNFLSDHVSSTGTIDSGVINRCFNRACEISHYNPVIVFIDEIDKIITRNNEQVMATLLEKLSLDGNFLVIGACNSEENLHRALTRPGRFDKKLYFGDLSFDSKVNILKEILNKKGINQDDLSVESIINYLPANITVATLDAIAKQAKMSEVVLKEKIDTVKMIDICEKLLEGICETVRPDEPSMTRTAWHEAGHATLALLLNKEITLATIKPSYRYLGYVLLKQTEEKVDNYDDFIKDIVIDIGGWAAEKIILKDLSIGATADFHNMQRRINFLTTYSGSSGTHLISTDPALNINNSFDERNDMYRIKKKRTKKYIKTTVKILKNHKELLIKIFDILKLKERVTGEELNKIYNEYKKNKRINKMIQKEQNRISLMY
jgi:cell division protease FtsH